MVKRNTYFITTPIYYVNDVPHIGHAYTSIACDVLARFKRLDGYEVCFLTGTDEHGHKVFQSAQAVNQSPQEFVDRMAQNFYQLSSLLNLSNDDFIRTTEKRHKEACHALWRELVRQEQIYLGTYAGWYAVSDEAFYTENDLQSTPNGTKIAPTGAVCEWVEEPSFFFRLSEWQQPLLDFYHKNPDFILPKTRRNEVLSLVESGLRDLSISRTNFSWGIPIPDVQGHVMYVWVDALTNYISAINYPRIEPNSLYTSFWPADLHMVGKDIIRFHTIYWPALLLAAQLQPPQRVFAHGWWTIEGQKMSKSLGNVISPQSLVQTYGQDQTRYFLLREIPFGNDGDFSQKAMIQRINSDLANDYGNLVQRVLSMLARMCDSKIPKPTNFTPEDHKLRQSTLHTLNTVRTALDKQAFHKALEAIFDVITHANQYVDEQAPWILVKTNPQRMDTVLYTLADTLRYLAILSQPFLPNASSQILDQLSVPQNNRNFSALHDQYSLVPHTPLPPHYPIFPRFIPQKEKQ